MTRTELHQYIIDECKKHPHLAKDAEQVAVFILNLPSMQSESSIRAFMKGYLGGERNA